MNQRLEWLSDQGERTCGVEEWGTITESVTKGSFRDARANASKNGKHIILQDKFNKLQVSDLIRYFARINSLTCDWSIHANQFFLVPLFSQGVQLPEINLHSNYHWMSVRTVNYSSGCPRTLLDAPKQSKINSCIGIRKTSESQCQLSNQKGCFQKMHRIIMTLKSE